MLEKVVELSNQIENEKQRIFVLSGVIVASDKFMDKEYLKQIRERINMTNFSQIYEDEKSEYANQMVKENSMKAALKIFDEDIDFEKVMKITGLSESELLNLKNNAVDV